MAKRRLAFVFAGGGARGALQVGALQALYEEGFQPGILVGTSVGAVNAVHLALNGFTPNTLEKLAEVWREASKADLLPANYLWLTVRTLFRRPAFYPAQHLRDFFIGHGVSPDLKFKDVEGIRLILVATDLNSGKPILFGVDEQDFILEGLLATTALPPWVIPFQRDNLLLMDGGVVSNLPIEPAMAVGATEIIALDLIDPQEPYSESHGFGPFLGRLVFTVEQRQADLELALAKARRIPVIYIRLKGKEPVPLWDFQHTDELIAQGYEIARQEIEKGFTDRPWSKLKKIVNQFLNYLKTIRSIKKG
jgi:NTE family protein